MRRTIWGSITVAALLTACGGGGGDATGSTTTEAQRISTSVAPTTTDAPTRTGSRENPLALGTVFALEKWDVTLVSWTPDATDAVIGANSFNKPPPAGHAYSLAHVRVTYKGEGEGTAWTGLEFDLVGADNEFYEGRDCDALEPEPISNQPDVEAGGTVEADVCIVVPIEQVTGGVVLITEPGSLDAEGAAWFALT